MVGDQRVELGEEIARPVKKRLGDFEGYTLGLRLVFRIGIVVLVCLAVILDIAVVFAVVTVVGVPSMLLGTLVAR